MKQLFFIAVLLPYISFGQTTQLRTNDTTTQKNKTSFIRHIDLVFSAGVPNMQFYEDKTPGMSSNLYSFKVFVDIKPTVQIGLGTQYMFWQNTGQGIFGSAKQTAQLFFGEINRIYHFKHINVTGGIFAGLAFVKESTNEINARDNSQNEIVAGFNMGVEYRIVKRIGLRAEVCGMTGMANETAGSIIWPAYAGVVLHL